MRTAAGSSAGWSGACRYAMAGADPSISFYDEHSFANADNLGDRVHNGVHTMHERLAVDAPTMTRVPRIGAYQTSAPAARFFQGYFQAHWSTQILAPLTPTGGQIAPRPLVQNWNPSQPGTKELHPATVYDPFPPGGMLYPKAV